MNWFTAGLTVGLAFSTVVMALWFLRCLFAPPPAWTQDEQIASAGTGLIFTVFFAVTAIVVALLGLVL
jgi:hypothetical protein